LLVFQDAFPLICGVTVNRQLFVEELDDDTIGLLVNDDGVDCCCCPLVEDIPDEL
jgi:hypothetical protein